MELREALKEQYRGGLAMLAECVERCPESIWRAGRHPRSFWRIAFHAAFFTHLYLVQSEEDFQPWPGRRDGVDHGLWESPSELEPFELPESAAFYTQSEMLDYLRFVDSLVGPTVDGLDLTADATGFSWYPNMSKLSHELMNLRHLQGHIGQLSELLMQQDIDTSWIARVRPQPQTPVPAAAGLIYPETRTESVADAYFGEVVEDPYRWLEDANSAETAAWVERQNEVTFRYLSLLPERDALLGRLTELYDYPRFGIPFREGGRTFYRHNNGLQNQSVLYVQDAGGAEPRVLLDPNILAADGTVALGGTSVSEDGSLLVYALSRGGSDWQEVHIREVATGLDRADTLQWVKFSGFSWTHDGAGFFYSRFPEPAEGEALQQANRNKKLYYHSVGTDQAADALIYERPDQPDWGIYSYLSEDGRYLLIHLSEGTDKHNRLHYVDLEDAAHPRLNAPVVPLFDTFDASYTYLGHDGETFYVMTDNGAPRRRVIGVDLRNAHPAAWSEIIPEAEDVLESVDMLGDRFIASYLRNACSDVRFYDLAGRILNRLQTPALGSIGGFSCKRTDSDCFYAFTSYLYPTTIYRYDSISEKSELFRAPEIDFDPAPYETRQVFYTSKDGTRVSMFLVHRRDMRCDGSNRVYLYGYGGFGVSLTPGFEPSLLVWLERGGVVAIPNLRGGGEYGEEWHLAGTKLRKQNVFDDFIAAAEYLVHERITQPGLIGIAGGSNGGLLVGAVLNQRPDLFGAAVPAVGVMDMLRFHLFTIGRAWTADYGSSENAEEFAALRAYSPLHNLKSGTKYPAVLVMTGDHDDRVVPAHSFKYAAALQAAQGGPAPTLIRIQTRAGHGAGKPIAKVLEEQADRWAFLLANLGVSG